MKRVFALVAAGVALLVPARGPSAPSLACAVAATGATPATCDFHSTGQPFTVTVVTVSGYDVSLRDCSNWSVPPDYVAVPFFQMGAGTIVTGTWTAPQGCTVHLSIHTADGLLGHYQDGLMEAHYQS